MFCRARSRCYNTLRLKPVKKVDYGRTSVKFRTCDLNWAPRASPSCSCSAVHPHAAKRFRASSNALLVLSTLHAALSSRWDLAALLLGLATHWKIFPFIYGMSSIVFMHTSTGAPLWTMPVNRRVWRFFLLSAAAFVGLGLVCYTL